MQDNSKIFESDLMHIFPTKSQPKVFLREFVETRRNSEDEDVLQVIYRIYFGYLIPKYCKVFPIDVNYLKQSIGFKHGLLLFYQFIDFVIRIHKKGMRYGHLDFQNLYFVRNAQKQMNERNDAKNIRRSLKSSKNERNDEEAGYFSVEFLFIEKNL